MDYTKQAKFQAALNYESIIAGHIANIAMYRDKNPRMYASSIETLILMCPHELREKAQKRMQELKIGNSNYTNLTTSQIRLYDRLWQYVSELLEKQNLIFRTSYIKTYE
jgi:hypothetical protein